MREIGIRPSVTRGIHRDELLHPKIGGRRVHLNSVAPGNPLTAVIKTICDMSRP